MKKFLILFLIFLLMPVSAQAFGVKKTMKDIMDSWAGESINSVIKCWGYPTNEKTMAGKTLYYWDWSYNIKNPTYTDAQAYTSGNTTNINAMTYGGGTRNVCCNRIIEVDDAGRVTSWQWSGNNCPYTQKYLYKQWINPKVLSEVAYQNTLSKQNNGMKSLNLHLGKNAELNRTMDVTAKYLENLKVNQNK